MRLLNDSSPGVAVGFHFVVVVVLFFGSGSFQRINLVCDVLPVQELSLRPHGAEKNKTKYLLSYILFSSVVFNGEQPRVHHFAGFPRRAQFGSSSPLSALHLESASD